MGVGVVLVTRSWQDRHAALLAVLELIAQERVLTRHGGAGYIALKPTPAAEVARIAVEGDGE